MNNKYFLEKLCRSVNENVVFKPPNGQGLAATVPAVSTPAPVSNKSTAINGSTTKLGEKGKAPAPFKSFEMFPKKKSHKGRFQRCNVVTDKNVVL